MKIRLQKKFVRILQWLRYTLKTELFQHLFGRIPEKHPGRFMKNPFKADEVIDKFIQYPREFICILRKAFEFHNEEPLKDKDQYYLKGFQRKSNQKKVVGDGAELKITFYANHN